MELRKTHLFDFHKKHGKLVKFAGFQIPIWFKGIIPEHMAVRDSVGVFDVTHIGRALFSGREAEPFLNYVTTNDVASLKIRQGQVSLMCNHKGGIKDDLIVFKLAAEHYMMVYNACNRVKSYEWLRKQSRAFRVDVKDVSDEVVMFAVQGPNAWKVLQKISSKDFSEVPAFGCKWTKLADQETLVTRTGYTGEDGFEVYLWNVALSSPMRSIKLWKAILSAGREFNIMPCGLGARDTLRLEAGFCLYGNEIGEGINPLEAGLRFAVKFEKGDFVGREALLKIKSEGVVRHRVGIEIIGRGIARKGHEIWKEDRKIGEVTSGTFSPILRCGIAMGYVPGRYSNPGECVMVNIRGKCVEGKIVKFPFYDTAKHGLRRT